MEEAGEEGEEEVNLKGFEVVDLRRERREGQAE